MECKRIKLVLNSEDDTRELAEQLAASAIYGSVWLAGDLGAGKTTLTRYWLRALGVCGAVKSPTYTLVEPYELVDSAGLSNSQLTNKLHSKQQLHSKQHGIKRVYHADLYRLQDPEELSFIGFEEYLEDAQALVIIEWASRATDYLPEPVMKIHITVNKEGNNTDGQVGQVRSVAIEYDSKLNLAISSPNG